MQGLPVVAKTVEEIMQAFNNNSRALHLCLGLVEFRVDLGVVKGVLVLILFRPIAASMEGVAASDAAMM